MTDKTKLGYTCAISAQLIWGLFPIYVDQLKGYDAFGFVAHRAFWSFLLLAVLFWSAKRWRSSYLPSYDEFASALKNQDPVEGGDSSASSSNKIWKNKKIWLFAVAAILLCINWIAFVWSAIHDHKIDASLGYYICPQVVVLLGVLLLGERLKPIQWVGFALTACGVAYMVQSSASMPQLSLLIAFSFAFYALAKKKTKMSALAGLTFEMGFLAVPGLLYLAWQCGYLGLPTGVDPAAPQLTLFTTSWWMNLLLLGSGVATLLPLALYATAVKHIPLSTVGLLQFIGPTIQFLIGLFLYQEAFDRSRFIGFVVVWMGVGLYLISIRQSKDVAVSKDTATTQE